MKTLWLIIREIFNPIYRNHKCAVVRVTFKDYEYFLCPQCGLRFYRDDWTENNFNVTMTEVQSYSLIKLLGGPEEY